MGRDKALLDVNGAPLWRRQRDVLAAAGAAEIFLSARSDQPWVRDARSAFTAVVHDTMSGCGPMVGVTAGLERATHPWLAVLAIDLPRMTSEWFRQLREQTTPGVGAVGRRGEFFEPLAAIYPREFRWLAWEALVKREFSMQRLVAAAVTQGLLKVREIETREIPLFTNWNREADRG
jgi:molybdopterin-guanine dinucleotide biosynthesis protein A